MNFLGRNLVRFLPAVLLLLAAGGCSPQKRIDEVRTYRFGNAGMALCEAYDQLLTNAAWSRESVPPEKLIVVRGTLKHSAVALAVFYREGGAPPTVSFFTVAGKRYGGNDFPLYLRKEVLLSRLSGVGTAAADVAAKATAPGGTAAPTAAPPGGPGPTAPGEPSPPPP